MSTEAAPLRAPAAAFRGDALAGAWSQELPGTNVELILEFEGRWELDVDGRRLQVRAFAAGLVAGPVRTRSGGAVRLVQLTVDPLAVPAMLGIPAGALGRGAADLEALLGPRAALVLERLDQAGDDGLVAGAEAWAAAAHAQATADLPRGLQVPPDVHRAVARLRATGGRLRIEALAAELRCSRRHLARRFAEWIGVTPSEFARLARLENATAALRREPGQLLGPLAHAVGYADHAHMDREFGALAGATPTAVAERYR